MTYSREWDTAQQNGQRGDSSMSAQMAVLLQNFVGNLRGQRVLDLGCAGGQSAAYLVQAGAEYCGIDGRAEAVERAAAAVPAARFACADFTREQPFGGDFDVLIDRASVPHNDREGIERCATIIFNSLKPGGLYISVDWFSAGHSELWRGESVEDMTRTNYPDGQFKGVGRVHFSTEQELRHVFAAFERIWIEERRTRRPLRGGFTHPVYGDPPWISPFYLGREYTSAVWDFVVRKPK